MTDIPDIQQPVPDLGHESLRQSVVAALDRVEEQIDRIDRAYLLLKGTGLGMQGTLNVVQSGQTAIDALQQTVTAQAAQIAALTERVTALENPTQEVP